MVTVDYVDSPKGNLLVGLKFIIQNFKRLASTFSLQFSLFYTKVIVMPKLYSSILKQQITFK